MNTFSPHQSGNWLLISPSLRIHMDAIRFDACFGSGPGGQSVNTTASAVQLTLDLALAGLPPYIEKRLLAKPGLVLTRNRTVCIRASRHRSQLANRRDALDRLARLLKAATIQTRPRKPTKPTRSSVERRLKGKKILSLRKRNRTSTGEDG